MLRLKRSLLNLLVLALVLGMTPVVSSVSFATNRQAYARSLVSQAEKYSKTKGKEFIAVSYINQAVKLEPQNLQYRYKRAFILGRARLYEEAIREFSKLMSQEGFSHAVRFRADCFMALGDMQNAAKDYHSFLRKAPRDGKVWSYLVEAFALMGNKQAALAAASRGLSTGSHWSKRLKKLQQKILMGQKITAHKPFSN